MTKKTAVTEHSRSSHHNHAQKIYLPLASWSRACTSGRPGLTGAFLSSGTPCSGDSLLSHTLTALLINLHQHSRRTHTEGSLNTTAAPACCSQLASTQLATGPQQPSALTTPALPGWSPGSLASCWPALIKWPLWPQCTAVGLNPGCRLWGSSSCRAWHAPNAPHSH